MLELGRYPACVLPCHTTLTEDPVHRSMSDRKHSGSSRDVAKTDRRERSKPMRDHRHARSSAEDPTISSTRSGKSVSTNARNHPRAELRDSDAPRQIEAGSGGRQSQGSPAVNHVSSSKSNGGRKRVCEEEDEEGSVWVEHTSSSGRIYYYNKKNGVSQWERPPSMAKRTKTDDIPTKSTSSSSSGGNKHSSQSHSSPSHSHSSHSQHTSSSHSHSRGSGSHRGYSSSSTHHSSHHTSHSSQGHHDRMRERDRGHGSHRRSNRGSRSSSKSASVSPTSSGRGRGPHDKATPNRHPSSRPHHGGRGGSKRGSVSPRVSAAGKQQSSVSTVAVSPCTPSIPHGISQSLVATQQVINQTSAIIKHQQKLLSASGDPATPNTLSPPPSSSSSSKPARPAETRVSIKRTPVSGGDVRSRGSGCQHAVHHSTPQLCGPWDCCGHVSPDDWTGKSSSSTKSLTFTTAAATTSSTTDRSVCRRVQ
ncbi:hypothetical protein GBAR_LOCUS24050 [Geodia barretti]|uniref:WW domain-containing protein n=1 Tax=Geodia barretti TaxID=519541 RepID=A0AA35XA71_GEOBA|nr:hypothetical protein GBAR_LOCUS24050 [Geodia barretti]